ncbi:MAG TPA: hypothetical protein VLF69_06310 [Candidatus Saccharimonadales bacterium]|nr:hypothetical protein [Candidatus Saccharimonadales bacterium]
MAEQNPSQEIQIASCNVKDALANADRSLELLDWVAMEQPAVAVFTEAYPASDPGDLPVAVAEFRRMGYAVRHVRQEISDDRPDAHGILMIAKKDQMRSRRIKVIKLAGRRALLAQMRDGDEETGEAYDVFGHQGNDRDDKWRLADIQALGRCIFGGAERGRPMPTAVVTGNTVERRGLVPHCLSAAGRVINKFVERGLLPSAPPNPNDPPAGLKRGINVAQRLGLMASGKAYRALQRLTLQNADPSMQPTMRKYGLPVKTDHIFITPEFAVLKHQVQPLEAARDVQTPSVPLTHCALLATVTLPRPDYPVG